MIWQRARVKVEESAKALLLSLLLHLRRGLADPSAKIADGMSFWAPGMGLPPPSDPLPVHKGLKQACEYVQLNLHEALSPEGIARQVHLTPTQLNRIFRSRLGTTVMAYVTRQRMESAKMYLSRDQISMAEISLLVGYPQRTHFSRVFNREIGMSPLEYRRRHGLK